MWDCETSRMLTFREEAQLRTVQFFPAGDSFVTLCWPSKVRVWEMDEFLGQ